MTAREFAAIAAAIGQAAEQLDPGDRDEYAQARKLIVFYLRSAAKKTREITEAIASKEGMPS